MTAPRTTRSIRLERAQRMRWWGRLIKILGISFTVLVLVPSGVAGVYMNQYWPVIFGTLVAVGFWVGFWVLWAKFSAWAVARPIPDYSKKPWQVS